MSAGPMLRVRSPGALTTIQDAGRPGLGHLGVPVGGACDRWSLAVANRLLGNAPDAAALEMTLLGAELAVERTGVIAIAGADLEALVVEEGRHLEPGASHLVRAGTTIRFGAALRGVRGYLAVPGGFDVEPILGSRSTCLPGAFGGIDGRPLAADDELTAASDPMAAEPGRHWPPGPYDPLDAAAPIRIVPVESPRGVHRDALSMLADRTWTVSPVSDRGGVRLDGQPLPVGDDAGSLLSTAMVPGAIQLPPSGEPIVLFADAPTIGGYPVPAVVARADLSRLAQRGPGDGVSLRIVTSDEARDAWRVIRVSIGNGGGMP